MTKTNTMNKRFTRKLRRSLRKTLLADIDCFRQLKNATVQETKDGPAIYIDRGASVLAVGHLDTVLFNKNYSINGDRILNCPQLDDRLGVWVILYLLPILYPDFRFDILLCDSEEVGLSTGQHYPIDKQYNWGFEFDRAGTDSVVYDYQSEHWVNEIKTFSDVGIGAFSDISYLEHLGCKFVNVGVGYHNQHSPNCYADLNETLFMVDSFAQWGIASQDTHFPHQKTAKQSSWIAEDYFCKWCQDYCDDEQLLCIDCQRELLELSWPSSNDYLKDDEIDDFGFDNLDMMIRKDG